MNPFKDWSRFFFGPISARPLGAFRIVFGLMVLIYLAIMSVEFDHWYTGAGLLSAAEAREAAGPLRFSPLQYTDNPQIAHALLAFAMHGGRGIHAGLAHPDHEHLAVRSACSRFTTAMSGPTAARTLCPHVLRST